ncbi:RNA polymerase sigma factor [Sphingomonas koreensis]|nr:RNA polymerase sigma factor [Sphingomonas koreensis]
MRLIALEFEGFPPARLGQDDPLPPEGRMYDEESGLDALYRGHAARLLRFFARRAGRHDAPDLVQEAFARMAGRDRVPLHRIEDPAAYLTRIATNLVRDRAKSASQRAGAYQTPFDDEVHSGIDPHRLLADRDALARLNAAVGRLNRRTRQIFLLHRVEGLSYAEIAAEVGMSVKGVKKQMAKALYLLRREVGPL